ncbi:phage tail spike protein [Clostridium saccharoperbutylacetonicum]|uniref:phage tail spike protein n=1 Tax=Clostridium saccharoperbutylacetonicum TaxID=36745 RepID=UPI0039ED4115
MIQIYTDSNPDLSKNGIIINPISCVINPKMNAENELEMEFSIDKDGLYKYIQNNNFIAVPTPDFEEQQLYRIYNTKKSMSGHSITAYARHIEFDLAKSVIFNKTVQGNGLEVLNELLANTSFIGHSDITIQDVRQYKMRTLMNVLLGSEDDSFINIWGGEISCNNYNLSINTKRGSDKGIRVTFGYNLEDIEEDLNYDDVITRLYPYSGDLILSSNTPYVDSPLIQKIGVLEDKIEFSDIKIKENQDDTEGFSNRSEAEAEMIRRCDKLFQNGLDKITANYVVKMQNLRKTREYKELGYDVLETICIGDTVHCYNKNIDIEVEARCISYKWDCISEEYIEIELGEFINDYVNMQNNRIDNLYKKIQLTEENILFQVTSLDNRLTSKIELEANKINAVVQKDGTGMGWELNQNAFIVACTGASNRNVTIDTNGLTVNNNKIKLKNSSGDTVFYVNTNGRCNADGGFVVDDGDSKCKIGATGISMTNEDGYTSSIYVSSPNSQTNNTTLVADDDFEVTKTLRVKGTLRAYGYTNLAGLVDIGGDLRIDKDVDISGTLSVDGKTLQEIIDGRIRALK